MSKTPLAGPLTRLTRRGRHAWARSGWVILICALGVVSVFKLAKLPTTAATPTGIELEIPGTSDGALGVMRAFEDEDPHNLDRARAAILWDFLLILSYSIGLTALLEWLAGRDAGRADALMGYAAWGALLAGVADGVENLSMLTLLRRYQHDPDANFGLPALIGTLASVTKWTLLFAVLGYTAWEIAKRLLRVFKRKQTTRQVNPTS